MCSKICVDNQVRRDFIEVSKAMDDFEYSFIDHATLFKMAGEISGDIVYFHI